MQVPIPRPTENSGEVRRGDTLAIGWAPLVKPASPIVKTIPKRHLYPSLWQRISLRNLTGSRKR